MFGDAGSAKEHVRSTVRGQRAEVWWRVGLCLLSSVLCPQSFTLTRIVFRSSSMHRNVVAAPGVAVTGWAGTAPISRPQPALHSCGPAAECGVVSAFENRTTN